MPFNMYLNNTHVMYHVLNHVTVKAETLNYFTKCLFEADAI